MKTLSLISVAAAGLAFGGCGSGSTVPREGPPSQEPPHGRTLTFRAPTKTTISNPRTGWTVRCTNHGVSAGGIVPAPGHGGGSSVDGTTASATLVLTRHDDGSLTVSCTG